jgi:hypothetical protein
MSVSYTLKHFLVESELSENDSQDCEGSPKRRRSQMGRQKCWLVWSPVLVVSVPFMTMDAKVLQFASRRKWYTYQITFPWNRCFASPDHFPFYLTRFAPRNFSKSHTSMSLFRSAFRCRFFTSITQRNAHYFVSVWGVHVYCNATGGVIQRKRESGSIKDDCYLFCAINWINNSKAKRNFW